jgi:radical SAM-linked protein
MMVVYDKAYPLRHIGHLDLMRTMQRALRRSGLPVQYSRGFNPHIRLSFASPLSVGIVGEREIMDVTLESEYDGEAFAAALSRVMPKNLRVVSARRIGDDFPTLMGLAAASRFRIRTDVPPCVYADAVKRLLASDAYRATRKTKSGEAVCDILPYIRTLEIREDAISFTAMNLQSGSLKPSVIMDALFSLSDTVPCTYTVIREAILAKDAQGNLVPLEVI